MTQLARNQWLHLAGNPPNVKSRRPPFWRLRVEATQEIIYFDKLRLCGQATQFNNRQGIELNASFLLWWALFGDASLITQSSRTLVSIDLKPSPPTTNMIFNQVDAKSRSGAQLNIYGAPDRVSAGSYLRWRGYLDNEPQDLATWLLIGAIHERNFSLGEDIANSDPLRRLWLSFRIKEVALDRLNNALVSL